MLFSLLLWTGAAAASHTYGDSVSSTGEEVEVFHYLGDPQIGFGHQGWQEDVKRFAQVATIASDANATAVVIAGDLVNVWNSPQLVGGFDSVWPKDFKSELTHLVPGNHDVNSEATTSDAFMEQLSHYRATFGANYHSFSSEYAEFVMIDSESLIVPYLGMNGTTDPGVLNETAVQWQWLEAALQKANATDKHKIIVSHHPPFLGQENETHQYFNMPLEPRQRLMALARSYGVANILCGHTHTTTVRATTDGISVFTVAGTARSFDKNGCGYRTLTVNRTSILHEYHELSEPFNCSSQAEEVPR